MGKKHLDLSPIEQIDLLLKNGHSRRLVPFVTGEHAPNVRAHALRSLIQLKDPAAIRRMAHSDNEHAINFLVSTCIAGEPPFCDAAIEAIEQNPAIDAEQIRQILDWGPDFLHGRAFTCFARRAGRKGVEYLNEGLESGNPQVREAAVRSLFRLFGVQIVPILTPMLSDPCDDVCLAVLDAVREALEPVLLRIKDAR